MKLNAEMSAAIFGLAGFELVQAYSQVSPSLAELRAADPTDDNYRRNLLDTNILFGVLVIILGLTFAWLTHNYYLIGLMMIVYLILAFWYNLIRGLKNAD